MKTIPIEIPEGYRAEWVNGVLTLVDDKPIEYKFKVGDKVICPRLADASEIMTITERLSIGGRPCYNFTTDKNVKFQWLEEDIHPYIPQDITERIKTFEDAYDWCVENGEANLVNHYDDWEIYNDTSKDIIAYLKLRIITCALNEGWKPTFAEGEHRYYCICDTDGEALRVASATQVGNATPWTLYFKSTELAFYAAKQFRDIYADFCGCKKGDEQ